MSNPDGIDFNQEMSRRATAYPRAVGSPLPRGTGPNGLSQESRMTAPPPPGRTLANGAPSSSAHESGSGMQRAMNAIRSAVPFVQRLLPLLDGNIITAVTNVLAQQQPQKPAPPVDLVPIQESVDDLQAQHRELHDRVVEQNISIHKVEDQLQMVREATDRNTLEQQELMEDLKSVGKKVNIIALIALGLLAVSVILNLILYLHIQRVLP